MGKLQKDEAFYKKLWSLMVPIVLQNFMLAMVAVADAFMLGGMDQNYMSAVSLATQIQFIQNMFLAAATASLGILGAQYWGKGDKKTLDEIFAWQFAFADSYQPYSLLAVFSSDAI
ncbi:MAG: MATE family efflux transporter [Lachnospiraceae bacterium]